MRILLLERAVWSSVPQAVREYRAVSFAGHVFICPVRHNQFNRVPGFQLRYYGVELC